MKSYFIFLFAILSCSFVYSQNVGIGTTTPQASFNVAAGNTVLFGTDTAISENKLMWLPNKGSFRAGFYGGKGIDSIGVYSAALGASSIAIGDYSTALCQGVAIGKYSISMGQSTAIGLGSTAMGTSTAVGPFSTAMGYYCKANGQFSTVQGYSTNAKSYYETVIGEYNDTSNIGRLFEIGNGSAGFLNNALTVLNNGNVGIGTVNPIGTLNVAAGNTVLFGNDTTSVGNKLMWLPVKGAFRVGYYKSNVADSIGQYSTAMGVSSASGQYSTAMGQSTAIGDSSTAMGESYTNGILSTAMGASFANGKYSTALGLSFANGQYSTAIGNNTSANSSNETVIGIYNDDSNNDRLFEIGNGTSTSSRHNALTVLANGNVGIGSTEPSLAGLVVDTKVGAENALFGSNTTGVSIESSYPGIAFNTYYNGGRKYIANGYGGLISLNESTGDMNFYTYGIGTAGNATTIPQGIGLNFWCLYPISDNLYSLGNANLRWANVYAANGVIQTSDARLKKNITSSTYGLKEIMKLQPVTYDWKDGSNKQPLIGLLAQDVQKLIPEAVVGNEQKEYLGIKYDALIPVLITGMQELENKNEVLGNENTSLEKTNASMQSKLSDVTSQLKELKEQVETLAALQRGNNSLIATAK